MSLAQAGVDERSPYATYKSIVAYDGTDFKGFQRQAEGIRTVQSVIEESLRKIGWDEDSIQAAGRTDTGVHARGQVICFRIQWRQGTLDLLNALNANLPPDVAVKRVERAADDFHPRFSALSRWYRYSAFISSVRDPFMERYAWRLSIAPDLEVMNSALQTLIGEHDFGAFGTAPLQDGSTVRTVYEARWGADVDQLRFDIHANAFLYRMVRRVAAVSVEIGWGKLGKDYISQLLDEPEIRPSNLLAPSRGLCLQEVQYGE